MRQLFQRIVYGPIYIGAYLLSLFPLKILYGISEIFYVLLFYVVGYRKSVVIQNLARAFPDRQYGEIQSITRKFYRSFAGWMAEIVKLFSISPPALQQQVQLKNFEFVQKCIAEKRSVIAGMGHFGNWEMLSILPRSLGLDVVSIYKPMQNRIADRLLYTIRSRFGMKLIPSGQVVRHILASKQSPALYLFIADQCPPVSDNSDPVLFLNQYTRILPGIEKLSKATNSAVVYFYVKIEGKGRYSIECMPICENPQEPAEVSITDSYKELLEFNIQAMPHNWLWTHKRWKR